MKKHKYLLLFVVPVGLVIMVLGIFAILASRAVASDSGMFVARPLTSASDQDVGQTAVAYTRVAFHVRNGTPEVKLVRSVTNADLSALGLPNVSIGSIEQPPLKLVIVKGDIDDDGHPQVGLQMTQQVNNYRYIGYVFDLWAGVPTLTIASGDGARFRTALNDPLLPTLPANAIIPSAPPIVPQWHYGDVAPTVTVPKRVP
ncbi:MAG: hypothetical protein ACYDAR_08715 [Thermomicrobiales bacterium]